MIRVLALFSLVSLASCSSYSLLSGYYGNNYLYSQPHYSRFYGLSNPVVWNYVPHHQESWNWNYLNPSPYRRIPPIDPFSFIFNYYTEPKPSRSPIYITIPQGPASLQPYPQSLPEVPVMPFAPDLTILVPKVNIPDAEDPVVPAPTPVPVPVKPTKPSPPVVPEPVPVPIEHKTREDVHVHPKVHEHDDLVAGEEVGQELGSGVMAKHVPPFIQ